MKRRFKLTEKLIAEITAYIRAGAYPHVAAEAAGVPKNVFLDWLASGEKPRKGGGPTLFRDLADAVRQAKAQARVAAEMKVLESDPTVWLKSGPGKDQPDDPGWTTTVKPRVTEHNQQINVLLHPQMQGLFAALLQVLAPYPEARAAVASALASTPAELPQ